MNDDIIYSYFEKLENVENKDFQAFREGWNCCLNDDIMYSYFEKLENVENKDFQAFSEGLNCCLKAMKEER